VHHAMNRAFRDKGDYICSKATMECRSMHKGSLNQKLDTRTNKIGVTAIFKKRVEKVLGHGRTVASMSNRAESPFVQEPPGSKELKDEKGGVLVSDKSGRWNVTDD